MFFLCKNSKKKAIFQIFYCFSVNNHGLYAIPDNLGQGDRPVPLTLFLFVINDCLLLDILFPHFLYKKCNVFIRYV